MKKNLLLFCAICFGFILSNAQETRYGLRIGANISSISLDSPNDIADGLEDGRFGVAVGFFAEYYLSEKVGLQPELQFSTQGNKNEALRVNYLQLPVVFKYNFTETFNIQLGPQAGLKIWEWEDKQDFEADFNTFDFAVVAGLGVNITDNFFADVRYAYGLTDVFEDVPGIELEGNNGNIQIAVGYRL